jgi:membrane associated rhomboid family serine protease
MDSIPSWSVPLVTRALILINVVVFFIELSLPRETLETVFYLFGLVPARFAHPHWAMQMGFPVNDYWPFLTHQFLHSGWLHIIGNMWTLWIFGDNVESRMGSLRFATAWSATGSFDFEGAASETDRGGGRPDIDSGRPGRESRSPDGTRGQRVVG